MEAVTCEQAQDAIDHLGLVVDSLQTAGYENPNLIHVIEPLFEEARSRYVLAVKSVYREDPWHHNAVEIWVTDSREVDREKWTIFRSLVTDKFRFQGADRVLSPVLDSFDTAVAQIKNIERFQKK
jgi:hypothetical protein